MASRLNLERTLRLLWSSGPQWAVANVVLLLVQATLPLVALYLMKLIIDQVAAAIAANGEATADSNATFESIAGLIAIAVVVALLVVIARALAKVVSEAQAQQLSDHIYELLHSKSVEIDLEYYDNSQYYDTLHRAQTQAAYRPINMMRELIATTQYSISLIGIIVLLSSLHWGIAIVLFCAAVPGVAVRLKLANRQYQWMRKNTSAERQAGYMSSVLMTDGHAKEVRLFNLGDYFQRRFRTLRRRIRREKIELATQRSRQELIMEVASTLAVFGAFTYIAYQTVQGTITIGALVMYNQAFQKGQDFLERSMRNLAMLYEDNLFLSTLYSFLDLKPCLVEPANPLPLPCPMESGIVFEQVEFSYPNSQRQALKGINLTIRPGEVIALVGENGSGKTTLAKLLCRLYDPTAGRITIDGVDVRQFGVADLRKEISVVFQDYARYHLTAQENIWFGDISLSPGDDKISKAAYRSGAHDVITRLPQQYDTILGKWFEDGEELSIGQWQKIALARAFLRESQLIVLDEPTSAMDPKAEHDLFLKFRELLQNQSAILITHRLSTVKMADRICVLDQGHLIESGSHGELMQLGGTYADLFERQAQQYIL